MVIECHEFFECEKKECAMFNEDEERNCWEIEPTSTSCTNILPESVQMKNKIFHCHNCNYYKHVHRTNSGPAKILGALRKFFSG